MRAIYPTVFAVYINFLIRDLKVYLFYSVKKNYFFFIKNTLQSYTLWTVFFLGMQEPALSVKQSFIWVKLSQPIYEV